MENKKTPKIRFKGFTDEWEQREAIEIFNTIADKGYPELPVLSATQEYGMVKRSTTGINIHHDKDNEVGYKRVQKGNFVMHLRSFQGGFAHSDVEGITSPAYTVLGFKEPTEHNNYFWKYILSSESFIKRLELITYGIRDGRSINFAEFAEFMFYVPSCNEQNKIAEYFTNLDDLITCHQRKCDKLANVKKSLLEKMFPKNDEKTPEIRFNGFTDEWEQRELTSEVELFNGLTYSPNDIEKSGTLVLRSSNVKNGEIVDADNVYVNPNVVNCDNVKQGDIIVVVRNGSRALIGKHAEIKEKMDDTVIGAFMTGLRSKNHSFINSLLDTAHFSNEVEKNLGATINQITNGMFAQMEFMFPKENEQTKIGTFFATLDNLITCHQRELEKLKNIKKSLLEKMFV